MAGVRVDLNSAAMDVLLKQGSLGMVISIAEKVAAAAGGPPDYEVESEIGKTRARASVRTATFEARKNEATDHNLLRALDAGRR